MSGKTSAAPPAAARVVKTISFNLAEWAVIQQLMADQQIPQFVALCRMALAEMAMRRGIEYPTKILAQIDPQLAEEAS